MKLFTKTILLQVLCLLFTVVAHAQEGQISTPLDTKKVNVYFFGSDSCPHCSKEKAFFEDLKTKREDISVSYYEISNNKDNTKLLMEVAKELNIKVNAVPFTVIGSTHFLGFDDETGVGQEMIKAIDKVALGEDTDILAEFISVNSKKTDEKQTENKLPVPTDKKNDSIKLPFVGVVKIESLALPVFTILIGLLDGFNPCALWVLLFLISILLGMGDKKKMWLLGGTFILTSTFVYFLFMVAWLNAFIFIGYVMWVRLIVGMFALYFGVTHVRAYFKDCQGGCEVTNNEERKKVLDRIKKVIQEKSLLLSVIGIILLAFAVNLIEALCSAGLPAIYTQVLAMNNLPSWQYYAYIGLYLLFFMLDDLIVFIVAMITMEKFGIESKYSRWGKLIGGICIFIIGVLMIFKPELLFFAQ